MKQLLKTKISEALDKLNITESNIVINKTKSKENGDYSTNIAMQLAGNLKKNPRDLAENIKNNIDMTNIKKIEIAGPGFINFYLEKDYLFKNLEEVIKLESDYGKNNAGEGRKVNIEFVSANPTGTLHMGNARGGAYGDSLARIMSFSGFDVTKEYYVNDAGNQVDNLALSIEARYKELLGETVEFPEKGYPGKEIIEIAKKLKEENESTITDIEIFKQAGIEYLLNTIKEDLHKYRIDYDVFSSEKDIRTKYPLDNIIKELEKNGYVYELDNAKWFACSKLFDDKDHVLQKNDGSYTYLVPDIAYHMDKYKRGYDKMIDVLGTDHHGYIARLKSSIKALDYDENKLDVKLLQLVRLVESNEVVRMSKRSGKGITLNDLIDEIGVNAARYYFSKYSLDTQMDFDLNLAKEKSSENPVYYVCYAYARICSILEKLDNKSNEYNYKHLDNDNSYQLLECIYDFKEVTENAALKELPHLITNYVYELATVFHLFYDKVRVITEDIEKTNTNMLLLKATKITLFNALNLIGVIPPEKM